MNVLVITHGPEITPGWLTDATTAAGVNLLPADLSQGDPVPDTGWDKVVVLGGHMGAYEEEAHRWLVEKKRFLRTELTTGTRILGVCLGAKCLPMSSAAGRNERQKQKSASSTWTAQKRADGIRFWRRFRVRWSHGTTIRSICRPRPACWRRPPPIRTRSVMGRHLACSFIPRSHLPCGGDGLMQEEAKS